MEKEAAQQRQCRMELAGIPKERHENEERRKGGAILCFFCVCGQPTCTHGCVTLVQQVALYLLISYGILHEYHFFVCGNFHMNIASTMHQLVLDLQSLDQ